MWASGRVRRGEGAKPDNLNDFFGAWPDNDNPMPSLRSTTDGLTSLKVQTHRLRPGGLTLRPSVERESSGPDPG